MLDLDQRREQLAELVGQLRVAVRIVLQRRLLPASEAGGELFDQPVEPEFRAGAIGLGWDPAAAQVVIEAFPIVEGDDADDESEEFEPEELFVVRIPVGAARAFADRTREIVAAGRS